MDASTGKPKPWKPLPMTARPVNSPDLSQSKTNLPTTDTQTTYTCTRCRSSIPITQGFKTCDACREKSRQSHAKFTAKRKREREAMVSKFGANVDSDEDPRANLVDNDTENDGESGTGGETWDVTRKRIKMEFADAKAKGKVPLKFKVVFSCLRHRILLMISLEMLETSFVNIRITFPIPNLRAPLFSTFDPPQIQTP